MDEPAYTLANDGECDRLEAQSLLDDFSTMHRLLSLPAADILDAGSGSGAYARALARNDPAARIVGAEINAGYVEYANALATNEGLTGLTFRQADLQDLPFATASFDAVWTKYVLYFLPDPDRALAELHRVLRPGGRVVIALNDWLGMVLDPPDPELLADAKQALAGIVNAGLVARLPGLLRRLGFLDVQVVLAADPIYSAIGGQSPAQLANMAHNLASARPYVARTFGTEARADDLIARWLAYLRRPDALMIVPLWHVIGTAPRQ